jgi:hypothetical protein
MKKQKRKYPADQSTYLLNSLFAISGYAFLTFLDKSCQKVVYAEKGNQKSIEWFRRTLTLDDLELEYK